MVETDGVPEWITFTFDDVWFGHEDGDDPMIVGGAEAGQPVPPLSADILEFRGERPHFSPVEPSDYHSEILDRWGPYDGYQPLLPSGATVQTASETANRTADATTSSGNDTSPNGTTAVGTAGNHTDSGDPATDSAD